MNFKDRIFGHKNLQITQDKIGQSCTLFSKPQVCQSFEDAESSAHACSAPWSGLVGGYNHRWCKL